jgi:hypothetical protein
MAVVVLLGAVLLAATSCEEQPMRVVGHPPVVASRFPQDSLVYTEVGNTVRFAVEVVDPDGDHLEHSFSIDGAAVGDQPWWAYVVDDSGPAVVAYAVTDGHYERRVEWTLFRSHANRPPSISSFVPEERALTVDLGQPVEFSIDATDPDDDPLQLYFRVDGTLASREQRFVLVPSRAGRVTVEAFVWDGELVVTHRWVVSVPGAVDRPPLIYDYQPRHDELGVRVGDEVQFFIEAHDPDGDAVAYRFAVDSTVVSNRKWFAFSPESAGTFVVEATASSGGLAASRLWVVTVRENAPPIIVNRVPSATDLEASVGQRIDFWVEAVDPDDDPVEVAFHVDGEVVTTEPGGGIGVTPTEARVYVVLVTVSDGRLVTEAAWQVTAESHTTNSPPQIVAYEPSYHRVNVRAGEPVVFDCQVTDPEGDALELFYSVDGHRVQTESTFTFTAEPGTYGVEFVADDGELTATRNWIVTVVDASLSLGGRVRDAVTGDPIAGVAVEIDHMAAVTDASGVFAFDGVGADGATLSVRDEDDPASFGAYFDHARVYSVDDGTHLEMCLLPNLDLETAYYTDFHQLYRAMTDIPGIPTPTAQRRWELPVDLHVPPFSSGGLDYQATITSVVSEFNGIFAFPAFRLVGAVPAVGVRVAFDPDIYVDTYEVLERSDDYYPIKGLVRFRTHYSPNSLEAFKVVIRHELGHALGLKHSADPGHLMVGGQAPRTAWFAQDELNVLHALHRIPRGHEMLDHLRD